MTDQTSDTRLPPRILLVDDERLVLATIGQGLSRHGYAVKTASNAEEGLSAVRAEKFDLLILDIRLAESNGLHLAREMRTLSDAPIIFLTAFDDASFIEEAVSIGGYAYLVKPIGINQLVPMIEATMARAADARRLLVAESDLKRALDSDRHISVAVGVLMERTRATSTDAFETLRNHARAQRMRLTDVAANLVDAADTVNKMCAPRTIEKSRRA